MGNDNSTAMRVLGATAVAAVLAGAGIPPTAAAQPTEVQHAGSSGDSTRGRAAVQAWGDALPAAAARNDRSPAELRELLRTDASLWLDPRGQAFYEEPTPELADGPGLPAAVTSAAQAYDADQAPGDELALHSRPGSQRTIFLDFTGGQVSGRAWNGQGIPSSYDAWDIDGDASTFGPAERAVIGRVWQLVAEDYAVFDVDVTTEDPGPAGLQRSSRADQEYGSWVLITPSTRARDTLCGGMCGGIAYLSVFDRADAGFHQPAWVFSDRRSSDPKFIAEAASHEAGHNLGLEHDGLGRQSYYAGHGAWAPIMGVGYDRPITQWSRGEYEGATTQQDDLATMQQLGVDLLADEAGGTPATAVRLDGTTGATVAGVVTDRADTDVYAVDVRCTGTFTAQVSPTQQAPNLDASLRLTDASGATIAMDDPRSDARDREVATGLSAQVSRTLSAGRYHLEVDGVGALDPRRTGYSDYASIGPYTLHVTGCLGTDPMDPEPPTEPPTDPQPPTEPPTDPPLDPEPPVDPDTPSERAGRPTVTAVAAGRPGGALTATVQWRPGAHGKAVTGFQLMALQVDRRGRGRLRLLSDDLTEGMRRVSVRLPRRGTWVFRVRALDSDGHSRWSARSARVRPR